MSNLNMNDYVLANAQFSIGSWDIIHDECSEEWISHEPIV